MFVYVCAYVCQYIYIYKFFQFLLVYIIICTIPNIKFLSREVDMTNSLLIGFTKC